MTRPLGVMSVPFVPPVDKDRKRERLRGLIDVRGTAVDEFGSREPTWWPAAYRGAGMLFGMSGGVILIDMHELSLKEKCRC